MADDAAAREQAAAPEWAVALAKECHDYYCTAGCPNESHAEQEQRIAAAFDAQAGRLREETQRALRTRPDYNIRCEDCGAPHNIDTSIPSEVWNAIARNPGAGEIGLPEVEILCTLCIDERLVKAGRTCDLAEFYFSGSGLQSRLYAASNGDVAAMEREAESHGNVPRRVYYYKSSRDYCHAQWMKAKERAEAAESRLREAEEMVRLKVDEVQFVSDERDVAEERAAALERDLFEERDRRHETIAMVQELRAQVARLEEALRHAEKHCPCGSDGTSARPHVMCCPVEAALAPPAPRQEEK